MPFYDINIRSRSSRDKDRQKILLRAFQLGYSCIAWTTEGFGRCGSNFSQIKPLRPVNLSPISLRDSLPARQYIRPSENSIQISSLPIRQLSRITLSIDDMSDAQSVTISSNNKMLTAYDIIAVCPGSQQILTHLCTESDVDIIAIDFTCRSSSLNFNKKLIDIAVARGIHFEILYCPLLSSSSTRRQVLANTRLLITYLRGRHLILSSGADTLGLMRGPSDVTNIAQVLGMNKLLAQRCVEENVVSLLKHAAERKRRFLPVEITSREDFLSRWPESSLLVGRLNERDPGERGLGRVNQESESDGDEEESDSSEGEVAEVVRPIESGKRSREEFESSVSLTECEGEGDPMIGEEHEEDLETRLVDWEGMQGEERQREYMMSVEKDRAAGDDYRHDEVRVSASSQFMSPSVCADFIPISTTESLEETRVLEGVGGTLLTLTGRGSSRKDSSQSSDIVNQSIDKKKVKANRQMLSPHTSISTSQVSGRGSGKIRLISLKHKKARK